MAGFNEAEIRRALGIYEMGRLCSKKLADNMDITRITMSEGHLYEGKVIIEHRETVRAIVPYKPNMIIDGPENGPAPSIWSIVVNSPLDFKFTFKEDKFAYEIPHTAVIENCNKCNKLGFEACQVCDSIGVNKCSLCDGIGFYKVLDEHRSCIECDGRGKKSCSPCKGIGRLTCKRCLGSGSLKKYQQLFVDWTVVKQKFANGELLERQLGKLTGKKSVYRSANLRNNPLPNFDDEDMREKSKRALQKFQMETGENSLEGRRIIRVQQIVTTIPIAEVIGVQNEEIEIFYVFGNEHKVYFPTGYPVCGNCCSIV